MKKSLFTLLALIVLTIAKAQSVDEIITKHIDALGGKDKIDQVTSLYSESSISVSGMNAATKTFVVNGKGYRSESDFNGQSLIQVVTDNGGWQINPFMGATTATAMADDQYHASYDNLFAIDPLTNYAAIGGKVELDGQEKVGDANTFKIKYTNKFGVAMDFYIDASTFYIVKAVLSTTAMGQTVSITTTYADYKKTDYGIFMPNTINVDAGQYTLAITVNKVEVNKTIDASIFDMPK